MSRPKLASVRLSEASVEKGRMMNLIDKSKIRIGTEEFGADLPMTQEEIFVKSVYASVDEAIARGALSAAQ